MKFKRDVSESYVESRFILLDKYKKMLYDEHDKKLIEYYKCLIYSIESEINTIFVEV